MHERTNIRLSAADRSELETVAANRNSPQKHVWRAKIVLLTADGHGTADIIFGYLWAQWRNARGRVLSRQSPVTPSSPNRSCQRQITVLALPVARMMSEAITPLSERLKVNFALIDQNIANQILWLVSHAPLSRCSWFFSISRNSRQGALPVLRRRYRTAYI